MKIFQKVKVISNSIHTSSKNQSIVVMDTFMLKGNEQKFIFLQINLQKVIVKEQLYIRKKMRLLHFLGQIQVDKKKQLESLPHVGIQYQYTKSVNEAKFTKMVKSIKQEQELIYLLILDNMMLMLTLLINHKDGIYIPFKNFEHQGLTKIFNALNYLMKVYNYLDLTFQKYHNQQEKWLFKQKNLQFHKKNQQSRKLIQRDQIFRNIWRSKIQQTMEEKNIIKLTKIIRIIIKITKVQIGV